MGRHTYKALVPPNFETLAVAKGATASLAAIIKAAEYGAARLGRRLGKCKSVSRCESGACPTCTRMARKWLMSHGLTIMEEISLRAGRCKNHLEDASRHWTAASIIPAGFSSPLGELKTLNLPTLVKTTSRKLQRAAGLEGVRIIGGIDISLNTENNAGHAWQLQLYLLINQPCARKLEEVLRAAFQAEPSATRPFHLRPIYMPRTALTYVLKNRFQLRSGYLVDGKHKVRKQNLSKADHLAELAMFLGCGRPADRLILKGIKREGRAMKIIE